MHAAITKHLQGKAVDIVNDIEAVKDDFHAVRSCIVMEFSNIHLGAFLEVEPTMPIELLKDKVAGN